MDSFFIVQTKREWKDNSKIEYKMQMRNTVLASAMHMSLLSTLGDKIFINEETDLIWEMQVFLDGVVERAHLSSLFFIFFINNIK